MRLRWMLVVALATILGIGTAEAQIGGNEPKQGKTSQDGFTVIDLVNPISGVEVGRNHIRGFQVYTSSSAGCTIMLKIFRPLTFTYSLVGSSNPISVVPGFVQSFPVDIPVQNGDLVGFTTVNRGSGAVDYDDSDSSLRGSVVYQGDVGTVDISNGSVLPYVRAIRVYGLPGDTVPLGYRYQTYVPVVTRAPGANGTLFRTEAVFQNPRDAETTVSLRFVPTETDGEGSAETAEITLAAGETKTIHDVLQEVFTKDAATGLLGVTADIDIYSRWRIVNDTEMGPFGEDVPLAIESDGLLYDPNPLVEGRNALRLAGAAETANVRTNFGAVNLSTTDELEFSLQAYDASGAPLGEAHSYRLPRLSHRQWNRVLTDELGLPAGLDNVQLVATPLPGSVPAEGATETIDSTDGRLYVYLSIIDNRSEDPVFVVGARRTSF